MSGEWSDCTIILHSRYVDKQKEERILLRIKDIKIVQENFFTAEMFTEITTDEGLIAVKESFDEVLTKIQNNK